MKEGGEGSSFLYDNYHLIVVVAMVENGGEGDSSLLNDMQALWKWWLFGGGLVVPRWCWWHVSGDVEGGGGALVDEGGGGESSTFF
ncbi:UNVERIFIED_CONTAM: hypothetical protein ITH36_24470 [Salmonella enterica subsp. enterica serovar Weltevreden]